MALMARTESNLAESGVTTVPKQLRDALGARRGGRLVWRLMPDNTLSVLLKYAYQAPSAATSQVPRLEEERTASVPR